MLKIEHMDLYYGAIHALHDICFEVNPGEIVTLIGANGAGKTSILHAISGLIPYRNGEVTFNGQNITKVPPHSLVAMGLVQVPEGRRVFSRMSVMENLDMGAFTNRDKEDQARTLEKVFDHFPRLKERRKQAAGTLSGGEQQMLAMGRALMSKPKLLMMDEPSMGLSPLLVRRYFPLRGRSTRKASLCSWSSKTPIWLFQSPIAAMYWKPAGSSNTGRLPTC